MKVLVLRAGMFIEKEIDNTLEALQKEVEGYIEMPFLSSKLNDRRIDIIINDEGKMIDGLKIEIAVVHQGRIVDLVFGNIVFASNDDEGNTIGLTEEQIAFIKHELKREMIIKYGERIEIVKVLKI